MGFEEPYNTEFHLLSNIKQHSGDHIANNKMDEARVMDMRQENIYVILEGKVRERDILKEPGMGRRIIFKRIFKK